jgi:hypothetical protein
MESRRLDIWALQTMFVFKLISIQGWALIDPRVLVEHIGFYALSRSAHERADVFHAMLVTVSNSRMHNFLRLTLGIQLARRSSLLAQNFDNSNGSRQPLERRWEEWAERETIIRLDPLYKGIFYN